MNRKNIYPLILALCLSAALLLTGCTSAAQSASPAASPTADVQSAATPDPMADYPVEGPWGLSAAKNDMAALYTVFGTSLRDYGASMEIKSNGEMQYSVGMAGGAGSYVREGSVLTAQLTLYNEGAQETLELKLTEESGDVYLCCTVYDTLLWWTQNESDIAGSIAAGGELSAYDGVLSQYRAALSERYDDLKLSEAGLNYMLMFLYEGEPLENAGYCYVDIDSDGVSELLILPIAGPDYISNMVFDMYTLTDGVPVQLFSGGERDRYYLLSDGTLYNEGSMSALESVYRQLTVSGGKLTDMLTLHCTSTGEGASEWTMSNFGSEPQSVSEADANELIANWQAMITKSACTPFAQ